MTALNKQARQVQRYTNYGVDMMEWDDGTYVKYSDYLARLDELEAAEKRIAELEAREVAVKQFDDFQIIHYGGSEDYAKGYIDCQNNYNKALTAAGIGVKGE